VAAVCRAGPSVFGGRGGATEPADGVAPLPGSAVGTGARAAADLGRRRTGHALFPERLAETAGRDQTRNAPGPRTGAPGPPRPLGPLAGDSDPRRILVAADRVAGATRLAAGGRRML